MKRIGVWAASLLILASAGGISAQPQTSPLSLTDALARGFKGDLNDRSQLERALLEIERSDAERLPSVRAESDAITSRSTDVFAERPYNQQSLSATIAFDYPIRSNRISRLRRLAATAEAEYLRSRISGTRDDYEAVLTAYGELYASQHQKERLSGAIGSVELADREISRLLDEGQVSLITAASSREAVLALRSQLLSLESRRMTAQSRLRELISESSDAEIVADLSTDLDQIESEPLDREATRSRVMERNSSVAAQEIAVQKSRLLYEEASSRSRLTSAIAGFGGIAAARSDFSGTSSSSVGFGVYGLRVSLRYPLFDRSMMIDVAVARVELERAEAARTKSRTDAEARIAREWLQYQEAGKRVELLREWAAVEREREESLRRLIAAGVRREADLAHVVAARARREGELLDVRIERWRLSRLMQFAGSNP